MYGKKMNLSLGSTTIFEDADFNFEQNDKVGIVGVNGAGKTTFFRLIMNEFQLDSGRLFLGTKRLVYLPQEIVLDDEDITVWDFLFSGRPINKLQNDLKDIYTLLETAVGEECDKLLERMGKLQEELDYYDEYRAEDILLEIISGMNIETELLHKKLKELSGGQKSKISFGRVLFSKPEILCLDEPTNHLDISSIKFITEYLRNYQGSVLVISHDIKFLNDIVNKILFINKVTHKIHVYNGNYDIFKKIYIEEQRRRELQIVHQENEIKKLSEFVLKAKQASRTNHALKRMGIEREEKLKKKKSELLARERKYRTVKINIKPRHESADIPLEVEKLSFSYQNNSQLYDKLSFKLKRKERFIIMGENGAGKSTLLKLLVGIIKPDSGNIKYNLKTEVSYYAQEFDLLDSTKTIYETIHEYEGKEKIIRQILANFLFYGDDVYKKVGVLSPGEKVRVALCKILLEKSNLLILDEPTNHLDPETQIIIGKVFREFEGTIIFVSHSLKFIEQVGGDHILLLPSGKIVDFSLDIIKDYEKK